MFFSHAFRYWRLEYERSLNIKESLIVVYISCIDSMSDTTIETFEGNECQLNQY